ncbi:basic secretory protein-like protein [Streptomyces sp. ET3-23]|uniref:basic secretory protein-like protein n=1 Tax=Streptomyces sp. ET3-23 TaxID=2885643 RepID=UPI0027DFC32E|nr:basic secretory protein-like protein [Streptomyces sp. ET3-23]
MHRTHHRGRTAASAAAVIATAAPLLAGLTATAAHAEDHRLPTSGHQYRISNHAGGALQWDSTANGAGVHARDWDEHRSEQIWQLNDNNGNWSITVPGTNNVVDRDLRANSVALWNNVGRPNQQWWLQAVAGSRAWLLHNSEGGDRCLARIGDRNGDQGIEARPCDANDARQLWNLDEATAPPASQVDIRGKVIDAGGYDPARLMAWYEANKGLLLDQYPKIQQVLTGGAYAVKPYINVVFDASYFTPGSGAAAVWDPNPRPEWDNKKTIVIRPSQVINNPGDIGLLVHELAHQVQDANVREAWLLEGIADYYRKYVYNVREKPGTPYGADYNGGYNPTAYMLNYIVNRQQTGEGIIMRLNNRIHQNGSTSPDDVLREITGKSGRQWWTDMWNEIHAGTWNNHALRD